MNIIALIPARSGSRRLPNKNIRILGSHPLIAYSIAAAQSSNIFSGIYCSSDSDEILAIAHYYGASTIKRPPEYATDTSPDADWIRHALSQLYLQGTDPDCFMILRPTSPFRTADTIKRAMTEWNEKWCMKAIEPVCQHPAKMWMAGSSGMMPITVQGFVFDSSNPHLSPTQSLPPICIQNGSLEIRPIDNADGVANIYQPFYTDDYEGVDINTTADWVYAEWLIRQGKATLPEVNRMPYQHRNLLEEMYAD